MAYPTQNNQVTASLQVMQKALDVFSEIVMLAHFLKISKALVLDPDTGAIVSSNVTDETLEGTNAEIAGLSFELDGATYTGAQAWQMATAALIALPIGVPDAVAAFMNDAIKSYR